MKNFLKLIASLLICQAAGIVGSVFTMRSVDTWYPAIKKPDFTPPDSVFGPVWMVLYILMGISLFLIWRKGTQSIPAKRALIVFFIQLLLNISWSFAFFGCRSPLAGSIVIILLWLSILLTIIYSFKISKTASLLLLPYILWVTFAAALNLSIFILNT